MPKDGWFFDTIVRQEPIDDSALDPKEWVQQSFSLYNEEDLRWLEESSKQWYTQSEYSLVGNFGGAGFGDIAFVPGPQVLHPKGVRDPEEWYVSSITRRAYIEEIFRLQLELQMKNLHMFREAVGDRIDVIFMSGTDFGSQGGPFISPIAYREMFKPLHKEMNDWVHSHTNWKTFYHTCGSIVAFLDDFAEAGIDILNPVQISAAGMSPEFLKGTYGKKFVFWGGAIDAQHTLQFGTAAAVREEALRNGAVFGRGGGFVFNNVHNIQATVPTENIVALLQAVENRGAP
jgi:Uroporphyrinogen decarboxylase (URO-D)